MLKKTITFVDFDDEERTETFYFNLTKAEILDLQLSEKGGLVKKLEKIIETKDGPELMALFRDLVKLSYGEKSLDGKYFNKSEELTNAFTHTQAYSDLYYELAMDTEKAIEFVTAILPKDMQQEVKKQLN
jgi:hypothetical protein